MSVVIYENKKRVRDYEGNFWDEILLIVQILFLISSIAIFNWIYLDWDNPRYVMPMAAPLLMTAISIIVRGLRKHSINIILLVGAVLMLVQSFVFIDPSMMSKSKSMSHKDEGMYNSNYRYICLNKIMNDIDWDEDYISIRLDEGLCSYGEDIFFDRNKKG